MVDNQTTKSQPCRLYVGTSGYSYTEWIAAGFYPPGTPGKEMLTFYATRFKAIELNYTWYQMPKPEQFERMLTRVPDGFVFTAKLTRTMTHDVDSKNWRSQVEQYRHGIAPMVQAGRLQAILVQLGPSFRRTRENRLYLAHLLDELEPCPVSKAVEFRHQSWAEDNVFAGLEERQVSLVVVDAPNLPHLFPTQAVVTNPELFYIRFHGRNDRSWHSGSKQKQFDYDYSSEELQSWSEHLIPKLAEQARAGVVFFNNHVRGQAPHNAQVLIDQLSNQGYSVGP